MTIDRRRGNTTAQGALQVTLLDQVRLKHVFNGVTRFANCCSQIVDPHGATAKFVDDCRQQLAVHQIEAGGVDVQHVQSFVGHVARDVAIRLDLGIVAHPPQ